MISLAQERAAFHSTSKLPFSMLSAAQSADKKSTTGDWSSIIGIVTAIVGNILISFALNTQRYAHVRLEKEQNSHRPGFDKGNGSSMGEYGAIQNHIAEDRARKNARAATLSSENLDQTSNLEDEDARESDALIPKLSNKLAKDSAHHSAHENSQGSGAQKPRKSYLRSPLWWLGITLMITGEAGNFLAYGFAPASIVSPLGVVALISNCLVAPLFLHEHFRKRDLLGVIIAVAGTVTIVLSAQGSNPKLGPDEIWHLIKQWEFLVYLGVTALVTVILMVLSNRLGHKLILIDLGLVGLFGGYTALSTKGVASLLSYRLWRTPTFPITYLLVTVLVITAILQIKYVNRALQRFDSTRVIPTQFVLFTIFVIVGSAVLYRDFESATPASAGKFVGGCGLTFLGVWCLTSGRRDGDDEQNASGEFKLGTKRTADDEEHRIALVDDDTTPPATPRHKPPPPPGESGASMSTTSFRSAMSQQSAPSSSSSAPRIGAPDTPTRLQQTASTPVVPKLRHEESTPQTPAQLLSDTSSAGGGGGGGGGGKKRKSLTPRASLSTLFAPKSWSPLTAPLSSGLSVVVADQRGRLARGGGSSVRNSVSNANAFAANAQVDGGRSQRQSLNSRHSGQGEQSNDDERHNRSRQIEGRGNGDDDEDTGARIEAVVDERPRVGRGATVDIVTATQDGG